LAVVSGRRAGRRHEEIRAQRAAPRHDAVSRRQEILDAALDRFAARGFQGTSVREIARAVGVNEATLYHYFPSKAAILDAIIDQLIAERQEVFRMEDAATLPLRDVLSRIALRSLERLRTDRERKLVRLLMIEGPRLAVEGRFPFLRLVHESVQRLTRAFEALAASGRIRRLDPRLIGLQFMAPIIVFGFHQHGLGGLRQEPIPEAEFARAHVDVFVRALAPDGAEGRRGPKGGKR
jgi:AcrR family transcriptional regulator